MISILICDDNQRIANSLADYLHLKTEHEILPPVYSGEACLAYCKENQKPTILILDVQMPKGMNGYDVAKHLQIYHPDIKIIVNTIFGDKRVMEGMIRYGVKAYTSKDYFSDEITHAIHAVIHNDYYFPRSFGLTEQDIINIQNTPIEWLESITPREMRLAQLLDDGLPLKEVAHQMNISESVASKKRAALFKKTGTEDCISMLNKLKSLGML